MNGPYIGSTNLQQRTFCGLFEKHLIPSSYFEILMNYYEIMLFWQCTKMHFLLKGTLKLNNLF